MATIASVEPVPAAANVQRRLAGVVAAGFCAFLTLYAPQPLLPMLSRTFGVAPGTASLLVTVSTLAVALAAPLAGSIADRFGRKRVIVPAVFLLAVPTALAATASGFGELLFWRFLQGVFTPGVFAVTVAYINDEWEGGAGHAMAAYVTGTVVGGFCGRTLSALVATRLSWRWSFLWLGVLTALCGLAMRKWLPEGRSVQRRARPGAMLRHLRNPQLLATYAVGFCVLFSLVATFTYVNFHLAAPPFHWSTAALGMLFVTYLVGAVVTPFAGRPIDRVGHRTALVAALSMAIAGVLLTLAPSAWCVLAGLAVCCTGVFIAQSAASTYIGTVAREAKAAAVGLYVMFYYSGGSFGSAAPGWLWSRGGWPACVALIASVQALTILLALTFWRPGPRLTEERLVVVPVEEG